MKIRQIVEQDEQVFLNFVHKVQNQLSRLSVTNVLLVPFPQNMDFHKTFTILVNVTRTLLKTCTSLCCSDLFDLFFFHEELTGISLTLRFVLTHLDPTACNIAGAYSGVAQREVDIIRVPIKSDMQKLGMFMSNTAVSFTSETCRKLTHRNSLKSTLSVSEIKTTVWFFFFFFRCNK